MKRAQTDLHEQRIGRFSETCRIFKNIIRITATSNKSAGSTGIL